MKEEKIKYLKEFILNVINNPQYNVPRKEYKLYEDINTIGITYDDKFIFKNKSGDEFVRLFVMFNNIVMCGLISAEKQLQEFNIGN